MFISVWPDTLSDTVRKRTLSLWDYLLKEDRDLLRGLPWLPWNFTISSSYLNQLDDLLYIEIMKQLFRPGCSGGIQSSLQFSLEVICGIAAKNSTRWGGNCSVGRITGKKPETFWQASDSLWTNRNHLCIWYLVLRWATWQTEITVLKLKPNILFDYIICIIVKLYNRKSCPLHVKTQSTHQYFPEMFGRWLLIMSPVHSGRGHIPDNLA